MPKVSIITPCYNTARYIDATIVSAQAQTLTDWEMLVVDDGSTDDSAAIVANHAAVEPRLRLVQKLNGGVASARNAGYRFCTVEGRAAGEYLIFLDPDDVMEPTMLETLAGHLDAHLEAGIVCCRPKLIGEDGALLNLEPEAAGWTPRFIPTTFWMRRIPPHCFRTPFITLFVPATIIPSVCLIRRTVYAQTPGFDELLGHLFEDLDLFLHVALRSEVHFLPEPLLRYRKHASQSTANLAKIHMQEQKMYKKWRTMLPGLLPEDARRVRAGFRFREGRIASMIGFAAAKRHTRCGEWGVAARFLSGAIRRYLPTILVPPRSEFPL